LEERAQGVWRQMAKYRLEMTNDGKTSAEIEAILDLMMND
jgi:hypothetical protein